MLVLKYALYNHLFTHLEFPENRQQVRQTQGRCQIENCSESGWLFRNAIHLSNGLWSNHRIRSVCSRSSLSLSRFFDKKDIKVIIDIMSYKNLKGSTIDWQNELVRSGFIVSKNPNAESSCSCGNSFKTKNNDIFNKIDALNKDDD